MIEINGVRLEGDFFDADFVGRYEAATRKMAEDAARLKATQFDSLRENYLAQIDAINVFFDTIFGSGISGKIFEGCESNVMKHLQAVEALTEWGQRQKKHLNDYTNKYTQRRHAQQQRDRMNR